MMTMAKIALIMMFATWSAAAGASSPVTDKALHTRCDVHVSDLRQMIEAREFNAAVEAAFGFFQRADPDVCDDKVCWQLLVDDVPPH
jgi:hypothetical protein